MTFLIFLTKNRLTNRRRCLPITTVKEGDLVEFFRDPFWGFGQFLLAAIDFVRSLKRSSSQETTDQQKPAKKPIVEVTTDWRFFVLFLTTTIAASDFSVFLPQVFAAGVPFHKDILGMVTLISFFFLTMVVLLYQRVLLGIFLFFHFCLTCTFTACVAWALEFAAPTYQYFFLLQDLHVTTVTGILITFLAIYSVTFLLLFPAYLNYRKTNGTPKQKIKNQIHEPPLQQH